MIKTLSTTEIETIARLNNVDLSQCQSMHDKLSCVVTDELNSHPELSSYKKYAHLTSPMLCYSYYEMNKKCQDGVYEDTWAFEYNMDGLRGFLVYDREGFSLLLRDRIGNVSLLRETVNPRLPLLHNQRIKGLVLDVRVEVELIDPSEMDNRVKGTFSDMSEYTKFMLTCAPRKVRSKVNILDTLVVNRSLIANKPYIERTRYTDAVYKDMCHSLIPCMVSKRCTKKEEKLSFVSKAHSLGYNGIIAKQLYKSYLSDNTRNKGVCVKRKLSFSDITGSGVLGYIDSPLYNKHHHVNGLRIYTNVSNGVLKKDQFLCTLKVGRELRHLFQVETSHKWYDFNCDLKGSVIELDGTKFKTNGELADPVFIRIDEDKVKSDCIINQNFMDRYRDERRKNYRLQS